MLAVVSVCVVVSVTSPDAGLSQPMTAHPAAPSGVSPTVTDLSNVNGVLFATAHHPVAPTNAEGAVDPPTRRLPPTHAATAARRARFDGRLGLLAPRSDCVGDVAVEGPRCVLSHASRLRGSCTSWSASPRPVIHVLHRFLLPPSSQSIPAAFYTQSLPVSLADDIA